MNYFGPALAIVLIGGGAVYLMTCLGAFLGLFRKPRRIKGFTPQVSVIIAARNEEKTIGPLLDDLLVQDYPDHRFEILVVDDCSDDRTAGIVRSFAERDRRIRLADTRHSQSPFRYKKRAVHEGILSSAGEIIMTLDADCRVSRGWIREMMGYMTESRDLVAGEVMVQGSGLTARIESLEFTGIQSIAAGLMNIGFPITCNGANLAYRRSAFERVGGFHGIGDVVSGDDDLLMQKIAAANASRVVFAIGKETAVRVESAGAIDAFLSKRVRWASKITRYPSRSALMLLSAFFLFFAAVPVSFIAILCGWMGMMPLVFGYGLKMSGDMLLTMTGLVRNGRIDLLPVLPFAELMHAPYIMYVAIRGCFGTFEWHGRITRAYSAGTEREMHDS
jgi:cellulose synthase/poly-beta-1,6-N-acetylglucosamine synthase-like glycosyltransferase